MLAHRRNLLLVVLIAGILISSIFLIILGDKNIKAETSPEQNLESIQILSGAIDVEGEGVCITLTDSESSKEGIYNIIHDQDLLQVVNLLASAGAEVISINDERLISISKIKANGMMIKVNSNEYASPFTIKAIGDPEILSTALEKEDSYVNLLKENVVVKIEKKNKLFIPRYKENINFKFAKPVEKQKSE